MSFRVPRSPPQVRNISIRRRPGRFLFAFGRPDVLAARRAERCAKWEWSEEFLNKARPDKFGVGNYGAGDLYDDGLTRLERNQMVSGREGFLTGAAKLRYRRITGQIEDADAAVGARMVARALEGPLTQIAVNAGMEGGVVVEQVRSLEGNNGLNAATGEYIDLVEAGIIDAAKVTRSALQNAGSIAALFLTTEAVIADAPDEGAGGGMPDMDF